MSCDQMVFVFFCVCHVFFFFKQKTVYEMRISDWSSDVCSSDLAHGGHGFFGMLANRADNRGQPFPGDGDHTRTCLSCSARDVARSRGARRGSTGGYRDGTGWLDRKSVGTGKGVSDRVDLGGRRFIKKKT